MRIGIFGGTFDPPHVAHLILAMEARQQLAIDRLLWVLTPDPPHKRNHVISPAAIRKELVLAAIQDAPEFELSTIDIDRPAPQYAVDTVRLLREQNPGAELVYIIGGDSLHDIPTWFHPQELVRQVDCFGVMRRPGDEADLAKIEAHLPDISRKVRFLQAPLLEISATTVRQRVASGLSYRYYLTPAVFDLIEKYQLYR